MKYAALFLAVCSVGVVWGLAQDKPVPAQAGMYIRSASGYTRIELAYSSGFKTSGLGKSMLSYGVAKIKGKWLYKGPSAVAQFDGPRPTFVLVSLADVSAQVIALVKFDVKKDHREAQYCEASAWSGVKIEDRDTVPVSVTRMPDSNNLIITPAGDLPAGEYLLIADPAKGYQGYDFGVK